MSTSRKDGRRPPPGGTRPRIPKKRAPPTPAKSEADGERIAKIMARAGLCSRREAEAWVVAGRVAINGTVLTSPAVSVRPGDQVMVDGAPLAARERTRLFLFNKPRGLVTTDRDPEGRATIFDHMRAHWPEGPRVVTVGRLDINTEGLLLLTNDGGLARVLELPATGWLRRYRVRANGVVDQAALDRLKGGVTIEGVDYAGIDATLDRVQGANVWLTVALREGKNREVRRLMEHVGLVVNRLIRVSFGPFQLGALDDGKVEEVRGRVLRDQLGPALAAQANADFTSPLAEALAPPAPEPPRRERPGRKPDTRRPEARRPDDRKAGASRPDARTSRFAERERIAPEPAPRRERPTSGPRKHVSALRADAAEAKAGPRRRTERGETADRKGRTIAVERKVSTQPTRTAKVERKPGRDRPLRDAGKPGRDSVSRDARKPGRDRPMRDAGKPGRDSVSRDTRKTGRDRPLRDAGKPGRDNVSRDARNPRRDRPMRDDGKVRRDRPKHNADRPAHDSASRDTKRPGKPRPRRDDTRPRR